MKITCRICQIQQGEFFTLDSMVPIYGQKTHKLLDIYNKCFQLNALLLDALPQVVCLECVEKLKGFFEFQLKAEKTNLELRKNLHEAPTPEVKTEFFNNYTQSISKTDSVPCVEPELEDIATEDDFEDVEDNFDGDEKTQDEDDEEIEDTDILFELYNKNDSCMENYLKFDRDVSQEFFKNEIRQEEHEHEIRNASERFSSNTTASTITNNIEFAVPSIEISRIQLPVQCTQVKTITLEPLVEMRKWQCPDCSRRYLTEEKLEKHRKLHKHLENSQCEICGTHLKSLYEYGIHMKTHGSERKYSCEFCDKSFSSRASLKAHLYIHTDLRPFKCEICGKTFQQKSILKTHMTLHTGKPFECSLCLRRFSRTAHLNIHMRHHNNVRPYQCTECPNSYMQKSHLDRHISSSHLGVRFQCTVCGKMYTKKPSLNIHMREAHCTTVSLYNCKFCDLDFSKQKGLYYHLKSKHPDYKYNDIN